MDLNELTSCLDELEAALPQMIEGNPNPGDFWAEFAGLTDVIEDQAGEHRGYFSGRVNSMLAKHGRYLAIANTPEDDAA